MDMYGTVIHEIISVLSEDQREEINCRGRIKITESTGENNYRIEVKDNE